MRGPRVCAPTGLQLQCLALPVSRRVAGSYPGANVGLEYPVKQRGDAGPPGNYCFGVAVKQRE
jgi:hypothetical protein